MTSQPATPGDALSRRWCSGAVAELFDTDTGGADDWALAAALCARCPVLAACREDLTRAFPGWGPGRRRTNPSSVVWAGAIFSPERRLWTRQGLTRTTAAHAARTRRAHTTTTAPTAAPASAPPPAPMPAPTSTGPDR